MSDITYNKVGIENFVDLLAKYKNELETRFDAMVKDVFGTEDFGSDTALKDEDKKSIQQVKDNAIQATLNSIQGMLEASETSGESIETADKNARAMIDTVMDEMSTSVNKG